MAFIDMDKLYDVKVIDKITKEVLSENQIVDRNIMDALARAKARYDLKNKKIILKKVRHVKKSENKRQGFQDGK